MSFPRSLSRFYLSHANIQKFEGQFINHDNFPIIFNFKSSPQTQLTFAHHLFDESPQRNLSSLNALLASHLRANNPLSTWLLFHRIHSTRTHLDSHTFTPVLGACSILPNPKRGFQVHALMIKSGSDVEVIPKTALLDMYSKYGLVDESFQLFNELGSKDVVSWNALFSNFVRNGKPKKALDVFKDMTREGVFLSGFTLCSLLKACSHLKAMRQGMQVHGLVVTRGCDMVVLATALIDFYSDVGLVDNVVKIYENLNCRKDHVLHNSFIAACVKNHKCEEAFLVMRKLKPNIVALTTTLVACSEISDLKIGKQIHGVVFRFGFTDDTQLSNVLIDMYAKCGKISLACAVFDRMLYKDVVSWTSMIDAYGSHGYGYEAFDLFAKMGKGENSIVPNDLTLLAVLTACSHSGLIEQGRDCFNSIESGYGLMPNADHYACFIDMLGRAGHIDEVWCLYHDMIRKGIKPWFSVWAALLNACGQNNDVSRGEHVGKLLFDLEPNNPGIYVLVSNFYAAVGKWDVVDQLRLEMKNKGLFKEAGSSWFTVSGGCKHDINNSAKN